MTRSPTALLGPYGIRATVTVGAMGELYEARDTELAQTVTMNVLPASVAADAEFQRRLKSKARAHVPHARRSSRRYPWLALLPF